MIPLSGIATKKIKNKLNTLLRVAEKKCITKNNWITIKIIWPKHGIHCAQ